MGRDRVAPDVIKTALKKGHSSQSVKPELC
jgi:hypothetical protein